VRERRMKVVEVMIEAWMRGCDAQITFYLERPKVFSHIPGTLLFYGNCNLSASNWIFHKT
jgi:hypothetical protein